MFHHRKIGYRGEFFDRRGVSVILSEPPNFPPFTPRPLAQEVHQCFAGATIVANVLRCMLAMDPFLPGRAGHSPPKELYLTKLAWEE